MARDVLFRSARLVPLRHPEGVRRFLLHLGQLGVEAIIECVVPYLENDAAQRPAGLLPLPNLIGHHVEAELRHGGRRTESGENDSGERRIMEIG